jgi:hypothetical protein
MVKNYHLWLLMATVEVAVIILGYGVFTKPDDRPADRSVDKAIYSARDHDPETHISIRARGVNTKFGIAQGDVPAK